MVTNYTTTSVEDPLPFYDIEPSSDDEKDKKLPINSSQTWQKTKPNVDRKSPIEKKKNEEQNYYKNVSKVYFENSQDSQNSIAMAPYSGPCNTDHLSRQLYLPLLISNQPNDLKPHEIRFINEYEEALKSIQSSSTGTRMTTFIRFGILYINSFDSTLGDEITIRDFAFHRNRGKKIKTAFYTCKGVTSPKQLVTSLTRMNYEKLSSNKYSYDIQLRPTKNEFGQILHLQYDEQFRCTSIFLRTSFPHNFDFIRDKSLSKCRSINNSYLDMFDFRIQLAKAQYFQKTDPFVMSFLRDVPIDEILFIDKSTQLLRVTSKLQRFVKYLKCTCSTNYRNFADDILISIGNYEEYCLNGQGYCELLMKSDNVMTIEILGDNRVLSGKQLYDLGMWFSSLCQSCVDFSVETKLKVNNRKACIWFSDIFIFAKKSKQTIKETNAYQLTTYKTQRNKKAYTTEDLDYVRKILNEPNMQEVFYLAAGKRNFANDDDLDQSFHIIKSQLETSPVPSARRALRKVHRSYEMIRNRNS